MKAQLIIRDLFWLVLVCALAVGWWVERRPNLEREHYWQTEVNAIAEELNKHIGKNWCTDVDGDGNVFVRRIP
jgi:hypothetical protein